MTTGAGYTMDNKLVDVYVNDAVVAADVRITIPMPPTEIRPC